MSEYWGMIKITRLVSSVLLSILLLTSLFNINTFLSILCIVIILYLFYVELAYTVRRLHDRGHGTEYFIPASIWLYVIVLVFASAIFLFMYTVYLLKELVQAGVADNSFGEKPVEIMDVMKAKRQALYVLLFANILPLLTFYFISSLFFKIAAKANLADVAAVTKQFDMILLVFSVYAIVGSVILIYFLSIRKDVITYTDYIHNSDAERQKRIEQLYKLQKDNQADTDVNKIQNDISHTISNIDKSIAEGPLVMPNTIKQATVADKHYTVDDKLI